MGLVKVFLIGLKNLGRRWSRTVLLGLSLFFLSFLTVIFLGYSTGVNKQMVESATEGFVGKLVFYDPRTVQDILWPERIYSFNPGDLLNFLRNEDVKVRLQYKSQGLFYYNEVQFTSLIIGCDSEVTNFLSLVDGSFEGLFSGDNVVYLTVNLAEELGVKVGDVVKVQVMTEDGWPNVEFLKVGGIFRIKRVSELLGGIFLLFL